MKKQLLLTVVSAGLIGLGLVSTADAALIGRLAATPGGTDYQAYYDDVANLTWLADANYAKTSGYDADGRMTWQAANDWAAGLTVGGISGWRLPDTLQPDTSCSGGAGGVSWGWNCTGSEMGDLYYNALGNVQVSLSNTGPFSNVSSSIYFWSATENASDAGTAWHFGMVTGGDLSYTGKSAYDGAWAVQSGDVSAVPVPAAVWLFGSGLLGLVGVARRKSANI